MVDHQHQLTVINDQAYQPARDIQDYLDLLLGAAAAAKTSRTGTSSNPGRAHVEEDVGASGTAASALPSYRPPPGSRFDGDKPFRPPVYIYAGFLPPGVNQIYIYDRKNGRMYGKEVIIQPTGADYARDGGDWLANMEENASVPYVP